MPQRRVARLGHRHVGRQAGCAQAGHPRAAVGTGGQPHINARELALAGKQVLCRAKVHHRQRRAPGGNASGHAHGGQGEAALQLQVSALAGQALRGGVQVDGGRGRTGPAGRRLRLRSLWGMRLGATWPATKASSPTTRMGVRWPAGAARRRSRFPAAGWRVATCGSSRHAVGTALRAGLPCIARSSRSGWPLTARTACENSLQRRRIDHVHRRTPAPRPASPPAPPPRCARGGGAAPARRR